MKQKTLFDHCDSRMATWRNKQPKAALRKMAATSREKQQRLVSFETWCAAVDQHVQHLCGLSRYDLDDVPYHDWFEQRVAPAVAARRAIRNAKSA